MDMSHKIVVIGGGPTGIGAAVRLTELGYDNWRLLDSGAVPGGLSRSFQDGQGFTWDMGGHVIFSHYQYFDDLMDAAFTTASAPDVEAGWNRLQRESWVRICETWVPYPFQLNIHRLPEVERAECLAGLEAAAAAATMATAGKPTTFEENIHRQFGDGIARHFMMPYNFKVWAVPPKTMTADWMGERVASVDIARVRRNVETKEDDVGWGPNATFRFPKSGGTGSIYGSLKAKLLPAEKCVFGGDTAGNDAGRVVGLRPRAKKLLLANGEEQPYDTLISTMALDDLLCMIADGLEAEGENTEEAFTSSQLRVQASRLVSNTTWAIGFGLKGQCPAHLRTTCWMYFPGDETPFYRCTVFSNYAAANVPEPSAQWSLMLEVNYSKAFKPEILSEPQIIAACLQGCVAADLMTAKDAEENVVSVFAHREAKGYPIPSLEREAVLTAVQPWLRDGLDIYSRGRFGGWRYEVANQDHSLMQGVEAVDAVLLRLLKNTTTNTVDALAAGENGGEQAEKVERGEDPCTQKVQWKGKSMSLVDGEPTYHQPNYVNMTRGAMPCQLARNSRTEKGWPAQL